MNASLVEGGAGEAEIAAFVDGWARAAGLETTVLSETTGRPSVIVRNGRGGGRTLLLCAHLDTVAVAGSSLEPRIDGDRLYGRGAFDMKAGLAAALIACRDAAADVVVAAVADEEHSSLGVQQALRSVRADAAIVTEPTDGKVIIAHKGFVWAEITLRGRAAHGSMPEEGIDAIAAAGPVLVRLAELDASLPSHPLLGRGSVHASLISGGTELATYPDCCTIALERRTLPGEVVDGELAGLLGDADGSYRVTLVREPFTVDPGAEIVRLVCEAAGAEVAGAPFWTDAAFIAAAGIPTVLFGPGGDGAHADVEWVSLSDTAAVTDTLIAVAERLCS
ncbi:MAG TPA: M20/M25/M40 family metallo-hydrolase [Solirubrobacter sp.]|nr:M20/M25/M40 family metallo-hydrolase [Solirubrobacter sp.]